MTAGTWPANLAPIAAAIIDGDTGAALKKSGAGLGVFSKPATGHCRVTLTGSGVEHVGSVLVELSVSAPTARIVTYEIDAEATPQELDIFTWDAAGVATDAVIISLAVYRLSLTAPVPAPP